MLEVQHPERIAKWLSKQIMFGATSAVLDYDGNALGTWKLRTPKTVAKEIGECVLKYADSDIFMTEFVLRTYGKDKSEALAEWEIKVVDPDSDEYDPLTGEVPEKPYNWEFWTSDQSSDVDLNFVDSEEVVQTHRLTKQDLELLKLRLDFLLKKRYPRSE